MHCALLQWNSLEKHPRFLGSLSHVQNFINHSLCWLKMDGTVCDASVASLCSTHIWTSVSNILHLQKNLLLLLLSLYEQKRSYFVSTKVALVASLLHFFFEECGVGCFGELQCETVIKLCWAEHVLAMILSLVKFSLKYQPNYWIFSSVNCLS